MRRRSFRNLGAACTVALALLSGSRTVADQAPRKVTCSFSHTAYSGYCKQTQKVPENTTPTAVCQDILSCLNNTACSKTYCNATTLRGGWKLVSVDVPTPAN